MSNKEAIVQIIYPTSASSSFDKEYYLNHHFPLSEKRWASQGLKSWSATFGEKGTDYYVQATLVWESLEAFEKADHKDEVMGDIKNFTSVQPYQWVGTVFAQNTLKK